MPDEIDLSQEEEEALDRVWEKIIREGGFKQPRSKLGDESEEGKEDNQGKLKEARERHRPKGGDWKK